MKPEVRESYSGITPSPLPLGSDASWGKDDGDTPVLSETDSLPTVGRRDSGLLRTSSTKAMRSSRWRRVNSGSGSSGEMGPVHVAAAAASSSVVVAGAAAVTGGGLGVSAGSVSEVGVSSVRWHNYLCGQPEAFADDAANEIVVDAVCYLETCLDGKEYPV